jgi:hypothetical protein
VDPASFSTAVSNGGLKMEWGGDAREVLFTLSDDGKMITIDLDDKIVRGDTTLTISGLTDIAGNEIDTISLDIEVERESKTNKGGWVVIVLVVLFAVIFLIIAGVIYIQRSKEEEEKDTKMPKEPKQI